VASPPPESHPGRRALRLLRLGLTHLIWVKYFRRLQRVVEQHAGEHRCDECDDLDAAGDEGGQCQAGAKAGDAPAGSLHRLEGAGVSGRRALAVRR